MLEARVRILERKVNELLEHAGIDRSSILEMEYLDAIDAGAHTGDFTAIKEHLKKVNRKTV